MRCPYCKKMGSAVLDGRVVLRDASYYRRRACPRCSKRWNTYERVFNPIQRVQHADGTVEPFSADTLLSRLHRHCAKLEVWPARQRIAGEKLLTRLCDRGRQTTTADIAEALMVTLSELHPMACLRFELEWRAPKDPADMLKIVWDFAERHGMRRK